MAKAGEHSDMFCNISSVGGLDIESGSIANEISILGRNAFPTVTKKEERKNANRYIEDLDKWVGSIERILEDVPKYMCNPGHPGRISRIPQNLREVDLKGYEPYILSIGPYHQGKPRLQHMEMRKRLVLKCFLENKPELTLKDCLKEITSIEPTARSFYSDIEMETEQFVQMLLLDSVFLLTMFCGITESQERMNEIKTRTDRIVDNEDPGNWTGDYNDNLQLIVGRDDLRKEVKTGENWYWNSFAHDLFLLENQLPFFVLQLIHNLAYRGSEMQLVNTMKYEVVYMLTDYIKLDSNMVMTRTEEVHHLLHLGHMFFRPTVRQDSNNGHFQESSQMFRLGNAMQLYEAGVHFEARSGSTEYSLLDITFDGSGKMVMPCLHVDDNTESLLRNLVALEQMKYPSVGLNISAYVVLLLHLLTNPKDVELLRRKGIIQHHLPSDKEMMYLVNRLSIGLSFDYVEDQYSLKIVFQELKHYSARRVPRWRAWLRHRHFSNPWTSLSVVVASLILFLTALQTYYAVYSYYFPCCDGQP